MSSPERPMTARSVMSNFSVKSDISQPSDEERDTRYDYDPLPAELRPTLLNYRRESTTPKLKTVRTSTATRLEKSRRLKKFDPVSPKIKKKKTKFQAAEESPSIVVEEVHAKEKDNPSAETPRGKAETTRIPFSLADPATEDWLVVPGDSEDPEANTLRLWEKQLKELMRSRKEEKMLAKQRGEDGPLFVKFYNDPQMRTLRTKGHQRAATFPMPSFFNKLPPSVASFSTPAPNDALLIGEGLTVFVLTLPDGSGYCNYHSGRVAVSMSRYNSAGKGLYTLIYEDKEGSPLIGYFTPSGSGCCYHHNGGIRMLFNRDGGSMFDEDGHTTRKWTWPADGMNLPVTVNVQINANLSLRCTSLTSMTFRFSCRGQSHKFSISPVDSLNAKTQQADPTQGAMLQSEEQVFFISKFAMNHLKVDPDSIGQRIHPTKILRKRTGMKPLAPLPPSEEEEDKPARELAMYRERIKTVVDNWMDHYRECIGISLPTRLSSSKRRSPPDASYLSSRDLSSSQSYGRQVKTSMGFYPEEPSRPSSRQGKHARSLTHPFPSPNNSRAASPLLQLGLPAMKAGVSPMAVASVLDRSKTVSPPNISRSVSSPHIKPKSRESMKPFKTGISKPKPKIVRKFTGCPIALHNLLLKGLESTPRCRCDKRHIPYISDLEYDLFLHTQVPKSQLVIICVVSSIVENSCACEPMMDAIYCTLNRNRFSPCNQCSGDDYRLLKYDLCQAVKGLKATKPLLIERHNVTPGTFLMYLEGGLVYADRVFNGYGTTKKDFVKQVQKSISDGRMGKFLPNDFKLSHKNGSKILSRNVWAYPVSGVMQDLVPFTPESGSGSTSRHSATDLTESKLGDTFTEGSFAEMSYGGDYLLQSFAGSEFNSRSQSRVSLLEASQAGSIPSVVQIN